MWNENWCLFLLLCLILFSKEDGISKTESNVLIGIIMALVLSCTDICNNRTTTTTEDTTEA